LQSRVVLLQLQELLGLDTPGSSLLGESLDLCTEDDDLEGKLVGELPFLLEFLLHGLVVPLIPLDISNQTHDVVLSNKKRCYVEFLAGSLEVLDLPGLGLIIGEGAPEGLVLVVLGFEHVGESVFFLDVLEEFPFDPLGLGVGLLGLALPAVEFLLDGIDLLLVLSNVALGLLDLLLIRLVMVHLGVQVQLVPLQVANQGVFLSDELVESLNLLGEHDNFVLEVLDLDFDVLVLVEGLFDVDNLGLVGLDLVVAVPEGIVESLDLLAQLLVLSVDVHVPGFLLLESAQLLLKFRDVKLEFLAVLNQGVELLLQRLLVLLDVRVLVEPSLDLGVPVLPLLDLPQPTLQDPVDPVVLDLHVGHLSLVPLNLVL
jgi:hypothetical protein